MKKNRPRSSQVSGMNAAIAMNSGIAGMVRTASVIICNTESVQPP